VGKKGSEVEQSCGVRGGHRQTRRHTYHATWNSPLLSKMKPNPPPDPSLLPDSLLELRVRLDLTDVLTPDEREALSLFQRLGNYMAAAMIYLRDNALLEEELKVEDIKPRLLGWFNFPSLSRSHY